MSLTAANATIMLAIAGLFPAPQQLQGFAADDIFSTDPLESAQTVMGVDGIMSAGFVFVEVKQSYTLQADSPSNFIFDQWFQAQQVARDIFFANGIVLLQTLGSKWSMAKGVLSMYPPMPDGGKLLKPRKFGITWQSISPALT